MSSASTRASERESVRRICGRLHQAYRGLRLYPSDHPTARHTLTDFFEVLTPHLEEYGPIVLRVTEDELLFEDEGVYTHAEPRGSLAFLLFRDGMRFLTLHPGIDERETEAFVDCVAHADQLAAIEYDLLTALWEQDLQHIEYEVVDPFLGAGGEELRDTALNDLRETVVRRLSELSPGVGGGGGSAAWDSGGSGGSGESDGVRGEALTAESAALTQADLDRSEWAVEGLADTLGDFCVVLLEIGGIPSGDPKADATLAGSLALVVERYLDELNVDGLELVVDRVAALEAGGRRPPEFAAQVFGNVATTDRLARLIALVGQSPLGQGDRAEALLGKMRDWILPTLLEMLAESSDKSVRKTALVLLDSEGGVPLVHLWPLMEDSRWYVVRNAVGLATRSGDPALPDHLEPLLKHPDARVRREVIRSLDTTDSQRSAGLLARALADSDVSVRVLAAHALSRHGSRSHVGAVRAQIESRDFQTRPSEEIAAFLAAYAVLGADATLEMLNKLWRRRLLGTKPLPLRLGAIQALGLVGSPSAREALEQAAKSGEAQIRRAAARALAESRARTRGEIA